jgi:hypothetical protein
MTKRTLHDSESRFNTKWRPAMAWMYMAICILDFALFPILWSILQAVKNGQVTSQWQPLTLQGAGLFHLAMGAVLGITSWSRGQEKQVAAVIPQPPPPSVVSIPAAESESESR